MVIDMLSPMFLTMPCRTEPATSRPLLLGPGLTAAAVRARPWRDWVRELLTHRIAHGFIAPGGHGNRVFAAVVDVRDGTIPLDPLPYDEVWRVQRSGRRAPGGANLNLDHALLRACHALSVLDGDPCYAAAADEHCRRWLDEVPDERGFWWWGWHRHLDLASGRREGHDGSPHEIHGTEAHAWELFWRLAPEATTRELQALWNWHVIDKSTGEINRHGDGQRGCDFAMTAGGIIAALAFAARQLGGPWPDRARLVADYHWQQRDPHSGLFAERPNAGRKRFDGDCAPTSVTGPWVHGMLTAFRLTGDAFFRDRALAVQGAWHRLAARADGTFSGALRVDGTHLPPFTDASDAAGDLSRGDYSRFEPRGRVDLWQPYAAGYEHPLATAQACILAHTLGGGAAPLASAKSWAAWIARGGPIGACTRFGAFYGPYATEWATHGTYAALYARAIGLFSHLHVVEPEAGHLQHAECFATEALTRLYWNGWLRGHPAKPYDEAIDGTGLLLHALLVLEGVGRGAVVDAERLDLPGCPLRVGLDVW